MTLDQYRTFSDEERELLLRTLADHTWEFKFPTPANLFDMDHYIGLRMQQRKQNTNITWPEKLSKKEMVLCKIAMMQDVLANVNLVQQDYVTDTAAYANAMAIFLKSVTKEVYAFQTSKEVKWPGLSTDAAHILNALFKSLYKSLKK
jgi:hypothetical protein